MANRKKVLVLSFTDLGVDPRVTAPTQHQRLIHRLVEAVVALLDVPVLVRTGRLSFAPLQTVVVHQGLVAPCEVVGMIQLLDRRCQTVGLMRPGHAA